MLYTGAVRHPSCNRGDFHGIRRSRPLCTLTDGQAAHWRRPHRYHNWAFARANGGTFILRIDDTDPTAPPTKTRRSSCALCVGWAWTGTRVPRWAAILPLRPDRAPDLYKQAAQKLWDEGKAYPCFCTKEQLDADRKAAQERKDPSRAISAVAAILIPRRPAVASRPASPHVLRIKVPENRGDVVIHDAVHGEVTFDAKELDDFVIFRPMARPRTTSRPSSTTP